MAERIKLIRFDGVLAEFDFEHATKLLSRSDAWKIDSESNYTFKNGSIIRKANKNTLRK